MNTEIGPPHAHLKIAITKREQNCSPRFNKGHFDIAMTRYGHTGSIDSSEDCSSLEDDPRIVSVQLLTGVNPQQNVKKAFQSMVDMLDDDLQVICASERSDFHDLPQPPRKGSSEFAIPCLATVLFFNGGQEDSTVTKHDTVRKTIDSFSKPDLLLNHAWNRRQDLESDFSYTLDLNDNDVTRWNRWNHEKTNKYSKKSIGNAPFLHFEAILKESQENERNKHEINMERDIGFRKGIFDFEVAERTLEARKQLETWPWEFHHKANTKKGITQCHWNTQDFYAYQPDRDVTRLYGDVIDTTKITKRKNLARSTSEITDDSDACSSGSKSSDVESEKRLISTTDFPLMGVREVHYGKQHLRYTLFVSDANWMYQVEFYRLLLRRYDVTLRDDFCFFTVYCGEKTDIQFALKKLGPKQKPLPLSSTVLQFKVHKVGDLVPLLPNPCQPVVNNKWQTTDHDGNIVSLWICPYVSGASDTASSLCDRESLPLDDTLTSLSEARQSEEDEGDLSLERLDSFVEPELPERMPLLQSSRYSNLSGRSRFGSRYTSSPSAGSSCSTSPERRPRRYGGYGDTMFSMSSLDIHSNFNLSNLKRTSTPGSSTSRISESSDDPENTNFYRKAKGRREGRRRNDGNAKPTPKPRSKSSTRSVKHKQKRSLQRTKSREEEVEVYV